MNIELEKKKLERRKVETAKYEMEFKILERMADIERIKENMKRQDERMKTLDQEIKEME